jgi:hypothetical protein
VSDEVDRARHCGDIHLGNRHHFGRRGECTQGAHGAAVSAVAKVKTNVGAHTTGKSGTHAPSNHGGAVSKAAHTKGTPIPIIQ